MDGTLQLSINLILYLIVIIFFPLSKRNKYFGLRFKKCFLSEKLWHKIHLRASIVTIPFALLDLVLISCRGYINKEILGYNYFSISNYIMEFSCKIYKYKRANLNLKRKLAPANLGIK